MKIERKWSLNPKEQATHDNKKQTEYTWNIHLTVNKHWAKNSTTTKKKLTKHVIRVGSWTLKSLRESVIKKKKKKKRKTTQEFQSPLVTTH